MGIDRIRFGYAFYEIKPTLAIRIRMNQGYLAFQVRISTVEFTLNDAVQVAHCFKSFDPPNDLAYLNSIACFYLKSKFHQFAKHSCGKLCEPDSPNICFLPGHPKMGACVQTF